VTALIRRLADHADPRDTPGRRWLAIDIGELIHDHTTRTSPCSADAEIGTSAKASSRPREAVAENWRMRLCGEPEILCYLCVVAVLISVDVFGA
jgi:hypothetical protein